MNTVTDWKGNEIKPGMEVCLIRIIDRPMIIRGNEHRFEDGRINEKPCWEIGPYKKVTESLTIEINEKHGEYTYAFIQPIDTLLTFVDDRYILAIKGISDKPDNP